MTHFEAFYGKNPQSILSYMPRVSKAQQVEKNITICKAILHSLKDILVMAHNRMKKPYKQDFTQISTCQKLIPKFYGPYTVLKRVGEVAYPLALSIQLKLHPFFHVSYL
jgi:hypothetical protein